MSTWLVTVWPAALSSTTASTVRVAVVDASSLPIDHRPVVASYVPIVVLTEPVSDHLAGGRWLDTRCIGGADICNGDGVNQSFAHISCLLVYGFGRVKIGFVCNCGGKGHRVL